MAAHSPPRRASRAPPLLPSALPPSGAGGFFATERPVSPPCTLGLSRSVPKVHHGAHPSNFEIPKAPHQSQARQEQWSQAGDGASGQYK